jgi:hypothetical protein
VLERDGEEPTLADAGRLAALRATGLSAAADPGMDRFARLVAGVVRVPVALVSLVEPGRSSRGCSDWPNRGRAQVHPALALAGQIHRDDLTVLAIRVNRHQPARATGGYATPTR